MDAPFKPDRFDHAVDHYVSARLTYAPQLIAWLARDTGTEGKRVLDLGCGPGFIANAIAPFADDVLGLDPSPNMVAAAQANAAPNARFAIGSSEDLSAVGAPVQLVTIGRAFHWMDRVQTLSDLDPLISRGGARALINDSVVKSPINRWWDAANAIAKSFAVHDDYNQHRASDSWVRHEDVLITSAFNDLRAISVYQTHEWAFERLLRNTLSRSSTTEGLLGARRAEMEAAMRAALAPFGREPWTSLNQHIALIARRSVDVPQDEGRHGRHSFNQPSKPNH
ncbi:MAG: methyltransferase domain-containing protein [Roseovarius sp.]|nr:methyltransferase domain-containing protein [Roseovarius sp.]